jgi:hypothetical protein
MLPIRIVSAAIAPLVMAPPVMTTPAMVIAVARAIEPINFFILVSSLCGLFSIV